VQEFAERHGLENIRCLPYQPFETLAACLSAADLQVVVMGDDFVGIVHPCKLYNILTIGTPFLYIGPQESHISEIAAQSGGAYRTYSARHGDVDRVAACVLEEMRAAPDLEPRRVPRIAESFSRRALLPRLVRLLECGAEQGIVTGTEKTASYMSATR
jgi:colanic acid biosynthesis glycosyl transferase WcaI